MRRNQEFRCTDDGMLMNEVLVSIEIRASNENENATNHT